MRVVVNNLTGKVLYGSNVDIEVGENETLIEVDENQHQITENSIYNFKTETFYEKSE